MTKKDYLALVTSIILAQLAGLIGSLFTTPKIGTWYAMLQKPSLSPANWVFGPVWTTLFLLMAIAAFLVWRHWPRQGSKRALILYLVQLLINILWSAAFFGLQNPGLALLVIALLWLLILITLVLFFRVSRAAGWLMLPYLLWVTFASYLNWAIWLINYQLLIN